MKHTKINELKQITDSYSNNILFLLFIACIKEKTYKNALYIINNLYSRIISFVLKTKILSISKKFHRKPYSNSTSNITILNEKIIRKNAHYYVLFFTMIALNILVLIKTIQVSNL